MAARVVQNGTEKRLSTRHKNRGAAYCPHRECPDNTLTTVYTILFDEARLANEHTFSLSATQRAAEYIGKEMF